MAAIRRICCTTDFSEPSRRALVRAVEVARRCGADLTLLHVDDPVDGARDLAFAAPYGAAEEEVAGRLARWKAEAERALQRPVTALSVPGPAAPGVVDFAREKEVDLLVVASHGRGTFERRVLGRVAEAVARQAPCDVLVVRAEDPGHAPHRAEVATDVPL